MIFHGHIFSVCALAVLSLGSAAWAVRSTAVPYVLVDWCGQAAVGTNVTFHVGEVCSCTLYPWHVTTNLTLPALSAVPFAPECEDCACIGKVTGIPAYGTPGVDTTRSPCYVELQASLGSCRAMDATKNYSRICNANITAVNGAGQPKGPSIAPSKDFAGATGPTQGVFRFDWPGEPWVGGSSNDGSVSSPSGSDTGSATGNVGTGGAGSASGGNNVGGNPAGTGGAVEGTGSASGASNVGGTAAATGGNVAGAPSASTTVDVCLTSVETVNNAMGTCKDITCLCGTVQQPSAFTSLCQTSLPGCTSIPADYSAVQQAALRTYQQYCVP
ncbi:hypothetical protein HDU88_008004 [Geranomyces variabilis]|nr:hypothetical protein HDU88_008004 [Geranomyces variabilis]